VCKVHGYAVAGGTDIALSCDLVVMADDARIGHPPARVWGCPTTMTLATLFDGMIRHSPEGIWFKQRAEEAGFHQAVRERFGRADPRQQAAAHQLSIAGPAARAHSVRLKAERNVPVATSTAGGRLPDWMEPQAVPSNREAL